MYFLTLFNDYLVFITSTYHVSGKLKWNLGEIISDFISLFSFPIELQ